MSRFDSDLDHSDWLHGPYAKPNAVCSQCREPFSADPQDLGITNLCDRCCDERDAKAEEERLNRAAYAVHGAMQDFDRAITKATTIAECVRIRRKLAELYTLVDQTERKAMQHADKIGKAS